MNLPLSRVKSLSKGSSSRRQQLSSSSNLRDSTALPSSVSLSTDTTSEDNMPCAPHEKSSFGWSKQIDREPSPQYNVNRIPSGRAEGRLPASVYSDCYKGQIGGQSTIGEDDFDFSEQTHEKEKPSWVSSKKVETYQTSALEEKRKTGSQVKWRDLPDSEGINSNSDDDLIAILQVKT